MKLHRIALQEFRKFRQPITLDNLTAGLNVIAGPNEAGKSTLAAAIRAAFLERYKTTKVADLAPWGMSGARPSVEIDFEHDGHRYLLRKSFLSRARCELLVDDGVERREGEDAENALATLLGFEFSAKGNSRPENGGIPGLLWIAQGEAQNLLAPTTHAQPHVREALTRLTGELTSTDGDSLFERVESERSLLRDGRSGRPKGAYKEAEDALSRTEQSVATLTVSKRALDADVDRLALLRRDYDKAQLEKPWLELEQRAEKARARLSEISRERDALTTLKRELTQADDTLALLHEQVDRDQRDERALKALQAEVDAARLSLTPASDYLARALSQQQQAGERLRTVSTELASVQQAAQRQDCVSQIQEGDRALQRGLAAIVQAEALADQVQTLQASAAQVTIDAKALSNLREIEQRLTKLRIQQNVGATRVYHQLDVGQTLQLAGRELAGEGETLVTQATTLHIPGVGTLRIEPGGQDLSGTLVALERAETEREASLRRLGVATIAEADSRAAADEHAKRSLDIAIQGLRIQAPDGVDALRAGQSRLQVRLAQLHAQLASFPAETSSGDLVASERAVQSATVEVEHAAKAVTTSRTALDTQQAKAQLLHEQWTARQSDFNADERTIQREQRGARLVEARATLMTLTHRYQVAEAALQASQPELIEQDARRFEQSAKLQRDEQQRRHVDLLQLQGKLEQAQAHGVGEQLAQAQAEMQRLTRRRDEFLARTQALDLLWQLLGERRADATQRLLQPLAQRLQHYISLLFPGAKWQLDEALMPTAVARSAGPDAARALEALSFGTREQLGVLARFAYADLLQQSGRPTLLILDDALVHADHERRDLIKRALYDAASRHQILLLTCHGDVWQDLGVPIRSVPEISG